MDCLAEKGCDYSIGATMHKAVDERIDLISEQAWQLVVDYPESEVCKLAETSWGNERLVIRHVRLYAQEAQNDPFPYWQHFVFVTNCSEELDTVDREHRQRAEVELVIYKLKIRHSPRAWRDRAVQTRAKTQRARVIWLAISGV